ncbi:MAG: GntR family transcriptional regulator [Rubrobacter sp.]|nr:GntR family transcriptional regulator [Rubrobacter sp.]
MRRQILEGKYSPGEVLHESRMAESLAVSRTPVREALRQLEREGLLIPHGSEKAVTNPGKEEFVDLYTCRMALERLVAERSAMYARGEDVEFMAMTISEAREAAGAENHAGVLAANTAFHDRMVESAKMPTLERLMDTIRGQILVVRRNLLLINTEVETAICDEHDTILDAIKNGDVEASQKNMELHMTNDIKRGIANFEERENA